MELHRDVVRFLMGADDDEVDAFYEEVTKVRTKPIAHSEAVADPALSRYMLRFFRFANCLAIFQYRPAEDRIIVRQCRRVRPKPQEGGNGGSA